MTRKIGKPSTVSPTRSRRKAAVRRQRESREDAYRYRLAALRVEAAVLDAIDKVRPRDRCHVERAYAEISEISDLVAMQDEHEQTVLREADALRAAGRARRC